MVTNFIIHHIIMEVELGAWSLIFVFHLQEVEVEVELLKNVGGSTTLITNVYNKLITCLLS